MGFGCGIRDPGKTYFGSRIQGSKRHRIRIRDTVSNYYFFRFVKHPEYLKEGQKLVFREGRTKAVRI
jgi:GTPase